MAFLKKAFHSIRRGNEMSGTRSGEANFLQEKENPGAPRSAMAFTGTAFKCEGNGKKLSRSQSIPFDGATLPDVVAERIATFLHGKDLINLGKTCKFWNDVSRKNFVWKVLVEKRFGKQADLEAGSSSPVDLKKLYFKLATSKKPATAFEVLWLNGDYLEKVRDRESEFGEVIQLNTVCWLQIDQFFSGVLPGKYALKWRMKFDGAYVNGNGKLIEFRARPEQGCGNELCSKWSENDFRRAERRHGTQKWVLHTMGEFTVTALCKVYVEIKGRVEFWCGGISWDYAELKPLN